MNYIPEKDQEMGQPKHYGNNMKEDKKMRSVVLIKAGMLITLLKVIEIKLLWILTFV